MKLFRNNTPMLATVISGLLISGGMWLQYGQEKPAAAAGVFVLSFLIGGWHQAKEGLTDTFQHHHLNVDILMVLAAVGASVIGYWLEGALLIFIFSLSGSLEVYATNKSTEAIAALMKVVPQVAKKILLDGSIREVAVKDLQVGDRLLVSKGASFPIDGEILRGATLVDESALSGESIPAVKKVGDPVFAGTLNTHQAVQIQVSRQTDETLFAQIIRMVESAQGTPSVTAGLIARIENRYVKIVLLFVPLMIAVFYFIFHWTLMESFYRGMVLLTVASPCALVASATPASLSAISHAARKGLLFKSGVAMENFGRLSCLAFDKTGTLTEGRPSVTDVGILPGEDEKEIFAVVYALENTSTHPIAAALTKTMRQQGIAPAPLEALQDFTGYGLSGRYQGLEWKIGKQDFLFNDAGADRTAGSFLQPALQLQHEGKTVIFVSGEARPVAYFALMDKVKPEANRLISFLKKQGVHTVLITGDNQTTGQAIGRQLGMDEILAECPPEEKVAKILTLKSKYELVGMVGDGINDAPALANADIGIAMGEGTDIAMETADVVIMKNELSLLEKAYRLSRKLKQITLQNILFSVSVIVLLILANVFQLINLPVGVIGHEGSTILVILNGLRMLMTTDDRTAEQIDPVPASPLSHSGKLG